MNCTACMCVHVAWLPVTESTSSFTIRRSLHLLLTRLHCCGAAVTWALTDFRNSLMVSLQTRSQLASCYHNTCPQLGTRGALLFDIFIEGLRTHTTVCLFLRLPLRNRTLIPRSRQSHGSPLHGHHWLIGQLFVKIRRNRLSQR